MEGSRGVIERLLPDRMCRERPPDFVPDENPVPLGDRPQPVSARLAKETFEASKVLQVVRERRCIRKKQRGRLGTCTRGWVQGELLPIEVNGNRQGPTQSG